MDRKNENEPSGLFQDNSSIFLGGNDRQQEEEEELEDQKRRNEELQSLVANYFGNTSFDDDQSIVSTSFESTNTSRYVNETQNPHTAASEDKCMEIAYKECSLYSSEQWQVLYQNAVREEKRLKELLEVLKSESKIEIDSVNRKYYLAEAESRRLKILLEQAQAIIEEKTDGIQKQEQRLAEINVQISKLHQSEESLRSEVLGWKASSNDLQQKLNLYEKGLNKPISEKQIRSHYEQEINSLQLTLQNTNDKLEKSEQKCMCLQEQIEELELIRDNLLAERDEYLKNSELERELQCRKCLQVMQELIKIKNDVLEIEGGGSQSEFATNSDDECVEFLNEFKKGLKQIQEKSKQELVKLQIQCEQLRESEERLKKELHIQRQSATSSTLKNQEHIISTLESELKRSISEQSQKRREIEKLENIIKEMYQNENELKQELSARQETESVLSCEKYEEFLKKCRNNLKSSIEEMEARKLESKIYELKIKEMSDQEEELTKKFEVKAQELKQLEEGKLKEKDDEINKLKEIIKCLHEDSARRGRKSFERENVQLNDEINNLKKIIKELNLMNVNLKVQSKHVKSPVKEKDNLGIEISLLKNKIQDLETENKQLKEEIHDRREKLKRNSDSLSRVVTSFTELELGVQMRSRLTEEKLLEAQNTIRILQSQLTEKSSVIHELQQQLSMINDNKEIVQDLVKKSAIFQEYMAGKSYTVSDTSNVLSNTIRTDSGESAQTQIGSVQKTETYTQTESEHKTQILKTTPASHKTNKYMSAPCSFTQTDYAFGRIQAYTQTDPLQSETDSCSTVIERRTTQLLILLEENKFLKDKLKLDRNALNELTKAWNEEMKNLNGALSSALKCRDELLKRISDLSYDIQNRVEINDALSNQLACLNEILNKYEVTAVEREQAFISENVNLRRSVNSIFEAVVMRVYRCISKTDSATNTETNL